MVVITEKARSVEKLMERFVGWAKSQPDVVATVTG
jgi:hypothetical protein